MEYLEKNSNIYIYSREDAKLNQSNTPSAAAVRDFNGTNRSVDTVSYLLKTSHRGYGSTSGKHVIKCKIIKFKY